MWTKRNMNKKNTTISHQSIISISIIIGYPLKKYQENIDEIEKGLNSVVFSHKKIRVILNSAVMPYHIIPHRYFKKLFYLIIILKDFILFIFINFILFYFRIEQIVWFQTLANIRSPNYTISKYTIWYEFYLETKKKLDNILI